MKQFRWLTMIVVLAFLVAACGQVTQLESAGARQPVTEPTVAPAAVEIPDAGIDLTYLDALEEVADGVFVQQSVFEGSTGTGVFESFVRLGSNQDTVKGFNTSGRPLKNDEKASPNFTRDLPLSAVPLQPVEDGGPADYREFRTDINQTAGGTFLSLDVIQVYISKTPEANPHLPLSDVSFGTCSALVWELPADQWIALNYLLAPGSGNGDMRLLIPDELFSDAMADCGADGPWYVYLYSEFGGQGIDDYGTNWGQDNGFEEWSVRRAVQTAEAFKTANGAFDREWTWTIDKSVDPDTWDLFVGEDGTSDYRVTLDATSVDSNFRVYGQAQLLNGSSSQLSHVTWKDEIGYAGEDDLDGAFTVVATAALVCDTSVLVGAGTGNQRLPAGETLVCTYEYVFASTPADPPEGKVWANRVTFDTGTGQSRASFVYTTQFEFEQGEATNRHVTVTDAFEDEEGVERGGVDAENGLPVHFDYFRKFVCEEAGERFVYSNVATIKQTGQTASASVTVNCYELDIDKDAETSFRWDWDIDKVEDDDTIELFLYEGDVETLNYTVTASATAVDHAVTGTITLENDTITLENDTLLDAVILDIVDVISPGPIAADVVCMDAEDDVIDFGSPFTLAAGESISCTYDAELPDGDERDNTATATQQLFSYDSELNATEKETADLEAEATVSFDGVIGDDNCVAVYDDKTDPFNPVFLGYACAQADEGNPDGAVLIDEDGDATFSYALTVGRADDVDVYLECGDTELTNEAVIETLAGVFIANAFWTVDVTVYCPEPMDETAWAANGDEPLLLAYNPSGGGNWATYVGFDDVYGEAEGRDQNDDGSFTTIMFAGRTIEVGTATFSASYSVNGDEVIDITVQLSGNWTFASGSILAVQDYGVAPSGNPAPGLFDHKVDASDTQASITVPLNLFYGVHAVVNGY